MCQGPHLRLTVTVMFCHNVEFCVSEYEFQVVPSSLPPTLAKDWSEKVFQLVIASSDQLMHVALYQWLVNQNETDKLLSVR